MLPRPEREQPRRRSTARMPALESEFVQDAPPRSRLAEERLRTLYEAVSGAVLVWNAGWWLIEANMRQHADRSHYTPRQLSAALGSALTVKDEDGRSYRRERPAMVALRKRPASTRLRIASRGRTRDRWLQGTRSPAGAAGKPVGRDERVSTLRSRRLEPDHGSEASAESRSPPGAPLRHVGGDGHLAGGPIPAMLCSICGSIRDGCTAPRRRAVPSGELANPNGGGLADRPNVGSWARRRSGAMAVDLRTPHRPAVVRPIVQLPREARPERACWSTPIFASSDARARTFAMYYRKPRDPSPRRISS